MYLNEGPDYIISDVQMEQVKEILKEYIYDWDYSYDDSSGYQVINDYDYINETTRERFYYTIIMADEYGRIAQYESSYMAPSDFCYFIEDLKPFDPRYTDFPWYPYEED